MPEETTRSLITLEDISDLLQEITIAAPDQPDNAELWTTENGFEHGAIIQLAELAFEHQQLNMLRMMLIGESIPPEASLASMFMLGWEAHKKFGDRDAQA